MRRKQIIGKLLSGIVIPSDTGLPDPPFCADDPVLCILMNVMQWLLGVLGFLAIIAFVISGLIYLTAAGDDKRIEKGKEAMTFAIIGVVVALSGFIIIRAIDSALNAVPFF